MAWQLSRMSDNTDHTPLCFIINFSNEFVHKAGHPSLRTEKTQDPSYPISVMFVMKYFRNLERQISRVQIIDHAVHVKRYEKQVPLCRRWDHKFLLRERGV